MVTYVLPFRSCSNCATTSPVTGRSPFEDWFSGLMGGGGEGFRCPGAVRTGNLSNAKAVGEGVLEYRIDWGPGYRVYSGATVRRW